MNKRHQLVVKQFMELGAQAIFDPKGLDSSANLTPYHQYIDFIQCSPVNVKYCINSFEKVFC